EFSTRIVVEEEQWFGSLDHEIIHRHRHKVDPDRIVDAGFDRDFELGADPIRSGDQNRVGESCSVKIKEASEAADFSIGPRPSCGPNQRLDEVDHAVARIDIDPCLRIGETAARHDLSFCPTSALFSKFVIHRGTLLHELRKQKGTSKSMILVPLSI